MPDALPPAGPGRVPLITQQARADCGIACLGMVAAFHGHRTAFHELRAAAGDRGHTLADLVGLADRVGLIPRPVRASLPEIRKLRLPAILHWRLNHYVVLTKVGHRRVAVNDPATGRRKLTWADLDRRFTGIALEVSPRPDWSCTSADPPRLRHFVSGISHVRRYVLVILAMLVVTQLLGIVPPVATQILIDEVVTRQDRGWFPAALAGLAAVMIVTLVLDGFRGWTALYTGTRLSIDMTQNVVAHLLRLPAGFVESRHLGDVMSRLSSLAPIRRVITDDAVNALVQFLVLLTTLGVMLFYSPALMAVSVAGAMAAGLLFLALMPATRRLSRQGLTHRAAEQSSLLATLRGFRTVHNLDIAAVRQQHWMQAFSRAIETSVAEGKLGIGRNIAGGLIATMDQLAFLAIGIDGVLDRELSVGVLVAFMTLRGRLASALAGLIDSLQRIAVVRVHVERLADITSAPAERNQGSLRTRIEGHVSARRLAFAYPGAPRLLADFSLDVRPREHVVITGPSGCGKTTLLRLLAGQLDPLQGDVTIDGIELSLYDRSTLRRQVGIVAQSDHLFEGTIAGNIAALDLVPDLARVRRAAVAACIWEDIRKMPMALHTPVGDTGLALSGGQLQRLIIARALYRGPRILFLDEATSHLDTATEAAVLDRLRELPMTIVSVAHRPGAIARAARVIQLGQSTG